MQRGSRRIQPEPGQDGMTQGLQIRLDVGQRPRRVASGPGSSGSSGGVDKEFIWRKLRRYLVLQKPRQPFNGQVLC